LCRNGFAPRAGWVGNRQLNRPSSTVLGLCKFPVEGDTAVGCVFAREPQYVLTDDIAGHFTAASNVTVR